MSNVLYGTNSVHGSMHLNSSTSQLKGMVMHTWRRGLAAVCLVVVLLLSMASWVPAQAGTSDKVFGVNSTTFGATNAYVIVPGVGSKVSLVRSVLGVTDVGNAAIAFYTNGPLTTITGVDAGKTNFMVDSSATNGWALADTGILVSGNTPNDQYARVRVAVVGTTNITIFPATAPAFSLAAGATLYRQGTNGAILGLTNLATSIQTGFIAVGQVGQPMLIDVVTSAAGRLTVGGEFYAPDK